MISSTPQAKVALITGVAGQDGAYLTQLLLAKGMTVHGLERGHASSGGARIESLRAIAPDRFLAHVCDITDRLELKRLLYAIRPSQIYNLAAQSSVQSSFDAPEQTYNTNVDAPRRLIELIFEMDTRHRPRLFQASSSEIFGRGHLKVANEQSPFAPDNPYADAKLQAHQLVIAARKRGLHASNGILFNHESPLRGENFVTRKISRAVAEIRSGLRDRLSLGDLNARRDWGHAREYVDAMWRMLEQTDADDYVLATGVLASTRDFATAAFSEIDVRIEWRGSGIDEQGVCARTGRVYVEVDPRFFRPVSSEAPAGDASKARERLDWSPRIGWRELCAEMVQEDIKSLERTRQ